MHPRNPPQIEPDTKNNGYSNILGKSMCAYLKDGAVCNQSILLSLDYLTLTCCGVWEGEGHITKPLLLHLHQCNGVKTQETILI